MIKLTEADKIIKAAYISLLNKKLKSPSNERIVCVKCKRGDKTLRKINNEYICNDCIKEQQNER